MLPSPSRDRERLELATISLCARLVQLASITMTHILTNVITHAFPVEVARDKVIGLMNAYVPAEHIIMACFKDQFP